MLRDPFFAGRVFREDLDELLALQFRGLQTIDPALSQAEVMCRLRQLKKRVALLIAGVSWALRIRPEPMPEAAVQAH